ncbi:unnamed protein product [Larinioides sclopetarius]|uniref:THAP-type domain-containing protein n=1 Tax=Larinioides sclopetarius TaxID=280406 RepID=A0AAV2AEP7_9ARAC
MPTCCAVRCSNNEKLGLKFVRLPVGKRNANRLKQWLHNIGRDKWIPNENSRLLEVHFMEDQFENHRADNRRLLKQTAVPSIFSHRLSQNSRKPLKYVLLKDSVKASFSVDFSMGDKKGNDDDQVSEEAPEFRWDVNSLVYVSEEVFAVLKHVENFFRSNEEKVLKAELNLEKLKSLLLSSSMNHFKEFPQCCNLMVKLVNVFVTHRVYFLIKKKNRAL